MLEIFHGGRKITDSFIMMTMIGMMMLILMLKILTMLKLMEIFHSDCCIPLSIVIINRAENCQKNHWELRRRTVAL